MPTKVQWLRPDSFIDRINIPVSVDMALLGPFITQAVEEWLTRLLSAPQLTALGDWINEGGYNVLVDSPDYDAFNAGLYAVVEPFLVYATYMGYILEGSLTATATGLVEKIRDESTTITDTHRAELRRAYKERAERRASEITAYVANTAATCAPAHRPGVRFGKAEGRTRSQFESTNTRYRDITPDYRTRN